MDDAYELLLKKKLKNESFSQVIRRSLGMKKNIMEFAGVLKNFSQKDIEEIKKNIEEIKKKSTKKLLEKK